MLYMIPLQENLAKTFSDCLAHITDLTQARGVAEAAIAVHSRHNLSGGSAIAEVLGPVDTAKLLKGRLSISGIHFHLVTERSRDKLRRGPVVAAYVSARLLERLLRDDRYTDLIYLPWTPSDEALFLHQHAPKILSPPADWAPPAPNAVAPGQAAVELPSTIRETLKPEERVLPLEHTIDPGFVNHRRIETIIGRAGQDAIRRQVARLPSMPDGLRAVAVARIYSDIMLDFCRATAVPSLGALLGGDDQRRLFCSTEVVGPCRDIYDVTRARNQWRPPGRRHAMAVEFHYSTAHIVADTTRSELHQGGLISMIAELHSTAGGRMIFHPLVMGGPWLLSPDPKWTALAEWWGQDFFENAVEDFDEFAAVRSIPQPPSCEPMRLVAEEAFKHCLAQILGGAAPKDWGGEASDFFSAHLHLAGRRVSGAFLLKGPARFSPMRLNMLGRHNDQIVRLCNEPAEVLFVQHCHEISPPVRATLRAFAVQPSRPRRYCLIDGRDSLWLLQAYGLYAAAVERSATRRRRPS
jgi:hypothetical protein